MQDRSSANGRVVLRLAALGLLAGVVAPGSAVAFTPESPEVQRLVARAVAFLESKKVADHRPGGKALVALALVKNGAPADHPLVVEAIRAVRGVLGNNDPTQVHFGEMYSPAVATIFLITLDPSEYSTEIQCLLDYLQLQQKPHGGWGYPERETGDTSMTQYAVLCAWEAIHAGFRVPIRSIDRVASWLFRTQDPSGGFGYQGTVSGSFAPVPQQDIRPSLSAAGLGSVYICADLLDVVLEPERRQGALPPALKEVAAGRQGQDRAGPKTRLDPRLFRTVQARGNRWMAANYVIDPPQWTYYYLYALERYRSFRELAEVRAGGGKPEAGPAWYNDGVRYLRGVQREDGSWMGQGGRAVDTAFAVLFLLRSTKKTIQKARTFGGGILLGGRGLPKETARAELRKGKVVAKSLLGRADQLLALLERRDHPDYQQAIELLGELPAEQLEALTGGPAERLRRLATDDSPQARRAAVRALARTRQLDNVPTLIYALNDTDADVAREARDALRRISRKPTGFGLADRPIEADRRAAMEKWKAWYLAIRPDAELDN